MFIPGQIKWQTLLLFGVSAILLVFAQLNFLNATTWGIGLAPDSIHYIFEAKTLQAGKSIDLIGSHWPPLYQVAIALWGNIKEDLLDSVKWMHSVLYMINVLLFTCMVYTWSARSVSTTLVGLTVITTSTSFLRIHVVSYSEPLFILFLFIGLLCLVSYLLHEKKPTLTIAALMFGLACLTRYVGISLIIAGTLAILVLSNRTAGKRVQTAALFSAISFLPLVFWIGRNLTTHQSAFNRQLQFHPIELEKLNVGFDVLLGWLFIPRELSWLIGTTLIIAVFFLLVTITKFRTEKHKNRLIPFKTSVIFFITYISFLLLSISIFDAHTPLDYRILIPVYLFILLALLLLLSVLIHENSTKLIGTVLLLCFIPFCWKQFERQADFVVRSEIHGIGFTNKRWQKSNLIKRVRSYKKDLIVYTNAQEPFLLYTDINARTLPHHTEASSNEKNPNFEKELVEITEMVTSGKAIIAYFTIVTWRWYLPEISELVQPGNLKVDFTDNDGMILVGPNL